MNQRTEQNALIQHGFIWQGQIVDAAGNVTHSGPPIRNIIPQEGIDHLAGLLRAGGTLISNWYVGVGEADYVPTNGTGGADLQSAVGESTAYTQATRPLWNNTYDGSSILTNLSNRAEFTFNATKRLYTGFLVASSTKGGTGGPVLSVARFASPYDVPSGSTFRLGVSLTLLPAA